MPSRAYEVRPKAVVTITDAGEVVVNVDLIGLPWEMENDFLAGHDDDQVQQDTEVVRDAFMASPVNHSVQVRLAR